MERRLLRHSAVGGRHLATSLCVLISITFYMCVVFGVKVFKKTDLREFASLLTAFTRCFAFSRFFFAFLRFFAFCRLRKTGPAFFNESAALRE
jgi:hypothetical protein